MESFNILAILPTREQALHRLLIVHEQDRVQRFLLPDGFYQALSTKCGDVLIGRPVSKEIGGATRLTLILEDRCLPLMFGFSSANRDEEISEAIKTFIKDR